MIDRILYAATAIALACVFALDGNFVTNLTRAFGGKIPPLPLGPWETGAAGILLGLALIAIWKEKFR